jgi:pimeloyl-ACP methyl ester carboxylesterase
MYESQGFGAGILTCPSGTSIAYNKIDGKNPGVIFLHGFRSDKEGGKSLAVQELCVQKGQAFVRFDAFGHGQSSGDLLEGTIGRWAEDAIHVIDTLTQGSQILVGSSFGGWISVLAALKRSERIAAFVGLAAAPDFTEDLLWNTVTDAQRSQLETDGEVVLPDCENDLGDWHIPKLLIDEGRNNLILRGPIALDCPVRLIHGQQDNDVPWQQSLQQAELFQSQDVRVILIKDAGHRLSRDQDMSVICQTLSELF